ncbi:MAG: heparan-alpha-glucosaminide N-acetyltransferase domain-containing protein [Nocardioidaceae bacterium]
MDDTFRPGARGGPGSGRRIVGIDMARCLALLGMMATHMLDHVTEDGVTWHQQLAGGRASALFAVLAGVSLALMSGRAEPLRGRDRAAVSMGLGVRALVIATIGFILGDLDSGVAVILVYYGLLFLLGLPFLGLRAGPLAVLAGGWLVVVPVLSQLLRPELPERGFASPTWSSWTDPGQLLSELAFTGYYPVVPWLAYLLAGMAIGRVDLSRVRTAVVLLLGGVALAMAAGVISGLLVSRPDADRALRTTYDDGMTLDADELAEALQLGGHGSTSTESWWWLAVWSPHTATPFDLAQTIGSAMAVIGLCLLVSRPARRLVAVVFGAGAMTLTLYTSHVVMLTPPVWPEDTPALYDTQVLVILGVGALFGLVRRRGPLEAMAAGFAEAGTWLVRRPTDRVPTP